MEAAHLPWRPLGELFVARGLISEAELETALAEQAATSKRLGEILVDRGLVSGPDLTSVLMEQLGVEISKEEGFGSGLWTEIKRRHRRGPLGEEEGGTEEGGSLVLVPGGFEDEEHEAAALPVAGAASELDHELEGLAADYLPPPPFGAAPEPSAEEPSLEPAAEALFATEETFALAEPFDEEPVVDASTETPAGPEPTFVETGFVDEEPPVSVSADERVVHGEPEQGEGEPESLAAEVVGLDFEAWPEPGHEPIAGETEMVEFDAWPEADSEPQADALAEPSDPDELTSLHSELDAARIEIEHLHEMLADAMTALIALSAEAQAAQDPAPLRGHGGV